MKDCLFCQIASGDEASITLYEDDFSCVFLDVYPASPGHMLIIPKQHVVTYDEMDETLAHQLGRTVHLMSRTVMHSDLNASGYNIQVNNGAAANQHVPHLHIHMIPRYRGDLIKVMAHFLMQAPGLFIGRKKPETLRPVAEKILAGLARVS